MRHYLLLRSCALLLLLTLQAFCMSQASAQTREPYTGSNFIIVGFESPLGIIEFQSDDLQVRYLQETQQLECRLPVNSLYTLNDTIPANMAYEVVHGSRFPEIILRIDAPEEVINAPRLNAEPASRRVTIEFQGTPNETNIPVTFVSEEGVINMSTNFDIWMSHFRATMPVAYVPFLTGRIKFTVRNARWLDVER